MNEYEVIVFENDRIYVVPEEDAESTDDDRTEIDIPIPIEDDIFSDEHPWDRRSTLRYRFRPDFWNFRDYELF
jgi:hypothetical protein